METGMLAPNLFIILIDDDLVSRNISPNAWASGAGR
jgi:hypothetical protein